MTFLFSLVITINVFLGIVITSPFFPHGLSSNVQLALSVGIGILLTIGEYFAFFKLPKKLKENKENKEKKKRAQEQKIQKSRIFYEECRKRNIEYCSQNAEKSEDFIILALSYGINDYDTAVEMYKQGESMHK